MIVSTAASRKKSGSTWTCESRRLLTAASAPADAYREAPRQFRSTTLIREQTRDRWGRSSINMLIRDVRYGLGMIRRAPGVHCGRDRLAGRWHRRLDCAFQLCQFLPVPPGKRRQCGKGDGRSSPATSMVRCYLRGRRTRLRGLPRRSRCSTACSRRQRAEATLSSQERPDVIDGVLVSGNYFDVLGLQPSRGRFFGDEENRVPGAHPVVVLSHDAWRRRFGADPDCRARHPN